MPPTILADSIASTYKPENQSPNLKTALRICDAFTSYSAETLKQTLDECAAEDYVASILPESMNAVGWHPMKKEGMIQMFPQIWGRISGMQNTVVDIIENKDNVILHTKMAPTVTTVPDGKPYPSECLQRYQFDANGKLLRQIDFVDTKLMNDTWHPDGSKCEA